jgi:hypothetical protein
LLERLHTARFNRNSKRPRHERYRYTELLGNVCSNHAVLANQLSVSVSKHTLHRTAFLTRIPMNTNFKTVDVTTYITSAEVETGLLPSAVK